jgi:Skp family chaperone for outer membrane proteins
MSSASSKRFAGTAAAVVLAAGVLGALPSSRQAGPTVGYVSTEIILRQTPGFAAAESTWNAEVGVMRAELESLSQRLDSALSAFDQTSIGLSPTARQEKQTELQQLSRQYQQQNTEAQTRADRRQRELMAPLQERIQAVVHGIRAERNLGLVFDLSAPGNGVVAADPALDLTNLVIRRLRGGSE